MSSRIGLVLVTLVIGVGCGAGVKAPVTVPVEGVVQLDGAPLADAKITFIPTTDKTINACLGTTDAEGKYVLTQASYKGASPGSYKVTIESFRLNDGKPVPEELKNDPMQLVAMKRAKQILPLKYSNSEKTELKAEVEVTATKVDFDLKSK
jgi:hypothetical protein